MIGRKSRMMLNPRYPTKKEISKGDCCTNSNLDSKRRKGRMTGSDIMTLRLKNTFSSLEKRGRMTLKSSATDASDKYRSTTFAKI